MITVTTIEELRRRLQVWRAAGQRIGLVPTMGNLHTGHLHLVRKAQQMAERVVVTIFVNPLQFGEGEDFDGYPRTLTQDQSQLEEIATDLLFSPAVSEVYSHPQREPTVVQVPGLSDILCGASRPGHFSGVATVVCKLFNMVQPDLALFGEKDFQQLLVIRRMAQDLCVPVEIVGVETQREADGLALSSRNGYLSSEERARAPQLFRILQETAEAIHAGASDYSALEAKASHRLMEYGFRPDYFSVRRCSDLAPPSAEDKELVVVAAAYLGKARLIDNLRV
jgi:pantoate--beta-alanine ligase